MIEPLMIELMEKVGAAKESAGRSDLGRYYAVLFTELEKMYAYYLLYIYPTEADAAPYLEGQE